MRKLILAAALALSVSGCAGQGGINSPAPLEQTTADEKGLSIAWASLGTTAAAVEQLTILGKIKKGTPTGDLFKKLLEDTEKALDSAESIRNGLSAGNYAVAMAEAKAGFDGLAKLMKGL